MNYQLKVIQDKKNKALKVLVETRNSLAKCAKLAQEFISQNEKEIAVKKNEVITIENTNASLKADVLALEVSINEANKIIGPSL